MQESMRYRLTSRSLASPPASQGHWEDLREARRGRVRAMRGRRKRGKEEKGGVIKKQNLEAIIFIQYEQELGIKMGAIIFLNIMGVSVNLPKESLGTSTEKCFF